VDRAIIGSYENEKEEEKFVVAARPGSEKRSPRGSKPRVVAIMKLDREIKIVSDPPPPLESKRTKFSTIHGVGSGGGNENLT